MIKNIYFEHYRKFKNISFEFDKNINVISGTNGTCKSSLLHIISNSFKAIQKGRENNWTKDEESIDVIKNINKLINPKIESLTRGDDKYNNPALNKKGTLFKCHYFDDTKLSFRRHNSTKGNKNRFSIKPVYKKGASESLPMLPIIYLGLFRLFSYGEFNYENQIKKINKGLPNKYKDELINIYYSFTGQKIELYDSKEMGDIKKRADFDTDIEGIDSNTISAGEDNLFIILTSLISLKYYYESIESFREIESILLIDELDASLHPEYQIKLLNLFRNFSKDYKIQFFFTTHSITLLEYALKKKDKVFYFLDNVDSITYNEDIDIYKVKMYLKNKLKKDEFLKNFIPILSEDDEARVWIDMLFNYYKDEYNKDLYSFFHLVKADLSGDSLKNIFNDDKLLRTSFQIIGILDGDKDLNDISLDRKIISLPGKNSPEKILFDYAKTIISNDNDFFKNNILENEGYTKNHFLKNILVDIEKKEKKIKDVKNDENKSSKGLERKENKKIFNKYELFWKYVIKHWIDNPINRKDIDKFFHDLNILFKKVSDYHDINSKDWDHKPLAKN
ncbi:AAA family ATPase [Geotoga petraea]|nr:AAA family ATPase [Geotoga petraea]